MLAKSFSAALIACIGIALKLKGAPQMKNAQIESESEAA